MSPSAEQVLEGCLQGESVEVEFDGGVVAMLEMGGIGNLMLVDGKPFLSFTVEGYTVGGRSQQFCQRVGSHWINDSSSFNPIVSDPGC